MMAARRVSAWVASFSVLGIFLAGHASADWHNWYYPCDHGDQAGCAVDIAFYHLLVSKGIYSHLPDPVDAAEGHAKMAQDICRMIGLQHMTPKQIDDEIWWNIDQRQGMIFTKLAIGWYCPEFLHLEYWHD